MKLLWIHFKLHLSKYCFINRWDNRQALAHTGIQVSGLMPLGEAWGNYCPMSWSRDGDNLIVVAAGISQGIWYGRGRIARETLARKQDWGHYFYPIPGRGLESLECPLLSVCLYYRLGMVWNSQAPPGRPWIHPILCTVPFPKTAPQNIPTLRKPYKKTFSLYCGSTPESFFPAYLHISWYPFHYHWFSSHTKYVSRHNTTVTTWNA